MTLYAPDGLLMIAMERFEGLTSSVDCNGDDRVMSLTFQSKNAFDYALQQWQFINKNDNGHFLLIANHVGCGPEDQRQPYLSVLSNDTLEINTDGVVQDLESSRGRGKFDYLSNRSDSPLV